MELLNGRWKVIYSSLLFMLMSRMCFLSSQKRVLRSWMLLNSKKETPVLATNITNLLFFLVTFVSCWMVLSIYTVKELSTKISFYKIFIDYARVLCVSKKYPYLYHRGNFA